MPVTDAILPENYRFLQQYVYRQSGIVLEQGKEYLFECRLTPIVIRSGLSSIDHLCDALRSGSREDLSCQVTDAMTTNETYFFRDPAQYGAIRSHFLERFRVGNGKAARMRAWSAAASAGQEAYSLAMLLLDEGFGGCDIEIVGTDLSRTVLERARGARYQQIEVNRGLPASLLVKYFTRIGVEWELKSSVRRFTKFMEFDLRADFRPLGAFDLVFCRNVMIYFDAATRIKIIQQIRASLQPGGWLLLGGAETSPGIEPWFERKCIAGAVIYVAR
jgi:chemotaxis protein methyltransferase CheR